MNENRDLESCKYDGHWSLVTVIGWGNTSINSHAISAVFLNLFFVGDVSANGLIRFFGLGFVFFLFFGRPEPDNHKSQNH